MVTRHLFHIALILCLAALTNVPSAVAQSSNTDAQNLLAQGAEMMRTRQFDEAIRTFQRAVQLQPDNAPAHIQLGTALLAGYW